MRRPALVLATALWNLACGGSPSGPSGTPRDIDVTLSSSELVAGDSARASARLQLSNGTSNTLTTGWQSDNLSVASVSTDGTILGLGNGRATIYIASDGLQGQSVVRVYPAYGGGWNGSKTYLRCVESTGDWVGFCLSQPSGTRFGVSATFTQTLGALTAIPVPPSNTQFAAASTTVQGDGGIEFSSQATTSTGTVIKSTWMVKSATADILSGTMLEEQSHPSLRGRSVQELELFMVRVTPTQPQSRLVLPRLVPESGPGPRP